MRNVLGSEVVLAVYRVRRSVSIYVLCYNVFEIMGILTKYGTDDEFSDWLFVDFS